MTTELWSFGALGVVFSRPGRVRERNITSRETNAMRICPLSEQNVNAPLGNMTETSQKREPPDGTIITEHEDE